MYFISILIVSDTSFCVLVYWWLPDWHVTHSWEAGCCKSGTKGTVLEVVTMLELTCIHIVSVQSNVDSQVVQHTSSYVHAILNTCPW